MPENIPNHAYALDIADLQKRLFIEGVPHPTGLIPLVAIRSGSNVLYIKQEEFSALIAAAVDNNRLAMENVLLATENRMWSKREAHLVERNRFLAEELGRLDQEGIDIPRFKRGERGI